MAKHEERVKIVEIGEIELVGKNKDFKKREVIGMIEGEYPQFYKFEFNQVNAELPDALIEGTYATIHFNLNGKKVDSKKAGDPPKYFTSLIAWKIEAAAQ